MWVRSFVYTRVRARNSVTQVDNKYPLLAKIADPTKSNRNHSRGKAKGGGKGSAEVVLAEIGGSTRPILPKPHLIIPIERERARAGSEENARGDPER